MMTVPPSSVALDAGHGGRLEVVGGCLGAGGWVIVWPHGTDVVEEDPLRIEVPDYGTFGLGDDVQVGGGWGLSTCPATGLSASPATWNRLRSRWPG